MVATDEFLERIAASSEWLAVGRKGPPFPVLAGEISVDNVGGKDIFGCVTESGFRSFCLVSIEEDDEGFRLSLASNFGEDVGEDVELSSVVLAVGNVPPARGAEISSAAADSRSTLLSAMASRSIAPTTLRPSGRAAEATPRSVFFAPTTSVRSDVLENVACQLATALSLSPSSRYMSGATPLSATHSL